MRKHSSLLRDFVNYIHTKFKTWATGAKARHRQTLQTLVNYGRKNLLASAPGVIPVAFPSAAARTCWGRRLPDRYRWRRRRLNKILQTCKLQVPVL